MKSFIYRFLSVIIALGVTGCGSGQSLPYMQGGGPLHTLNGTGAGKITHVIYIVQENRSFNDLFQGYPGAETKPYGYIHTGEKVMLKPVPLSDQYVIDHSAESMFAACNGPKNQLPGTHCKNNGFDKEPNFGGPAGVKYPEYVYVPQ